jgi:hypothetical protein
LAIVDVLLAVFLLILLLLFFAWAVWISYLVVFRGWRIFGPPPAPPAANPSSKNNPKPRPGPNPSPSPIPKSTPKKRDEPPPRSRRPGRR